MQTKPFFLFRFVILLFCTTPVLVLAVLSFSKNWIFPSVLASNFSNTAWYDLITGSDVRDSLFISLMIALLVGLLATTIGFFVSKTIAYHTYRKQLLLIAYLPFVLSPVILAVCLKHFFIQLDIAGTVFGVVFVQLIIALPYSIIFFTGFWNQQLKNYELVVKTLGGSNSSVFKTVIIPLSKPLLLICFFQCFLISWFEYGLTSVIGYGKVQTLTVKVYQFLTEINIFYAAMSCCMLIIPPVLLIWLNKKIMLKYLN